MKNCFEYKNYIGKIEMSVEDKVFYGKVHGINDLITFEGETFIELEKAFHEAVDDYLDLCKQCDKEPQKSYKGQFNVRIPPELHRDITVQSLKEGITLNQLAVKAFNLYIENIEFEKSKLLVLNEIFKRQLRSESNGWITAKKNVKMSNFGLRKMKPMERTAVQ